MPRRKLTKEEFIERARAVHGDKYNYDKVEYVNNHTQVIITCPIHGGFPMAPHNHTSGKQGCPECAKETRVLNQRMSKEEFVAKAGATHGDKYDYSLVEINGNSKTKVTIKCNKCGKVFPQQIGCHLNGQGCPECAKETRVLNQRMSKEEFVAKARAVHGDKYNYDKVKYVNNYTPVTITCPKHGDFPMLPNNHISRKCGCPSCNQSHLEEQTRILLEKNNIVFEPQKTFSWLRNKREMPLDFYLPEYNIAIECQGIQHYETSGNIFTKEKVEYTQKNDILKYTLCQDHNIPIFYIKYDDKIEEKINELISEIYERKHR